MSPTDALARLRTGSRTLDINSAPYALSEDFIPPSSEIEPQIATGTSANRHGGGTKISERAHNVDWTSSIYVYGSSDAEIQGAARVLNNFLKLAGSDPANPLYLDFKPNSDVAFDPLWGQYGAYLSYEVVHVSPGDLWPHYSRAHIRAQRSLYTFDWQLKPYSFGIPQRLASATGTIIEDTAGWKDKFSRGTIIAEGAGNDDNFHTNPVFGHGTYNTNWTDAANVTDTENTDERFVLYGSSSVKLVCINTTANTYTESLTLAASDHILSYHVKLPDGSAVSATQVRVHYDGSTQTTTFTPVGDDGWYRIWATVTGTGGAANAGVVITNGYTIYMDGAQAKATSYLTPFVYGDMLGVAWSGTAHASASDATAGEMSLPISDDIIRSGEGTVRAVMRMNNTSSSMSGSPRVWREVTAGMGVFYATGTTDWRMHDGTNTADSANDSWAIGDIVVLHGSWNPADGLVLYKNGASHATQGTYTPPTLGATLNIGSTTTPTEHIGATFMEFAIFDRSMTTAEVLADYTNLSQLTADNQRVGSIPYLWTIDGDDIVDNCLDLTGTSTNSPHTHYAVVAGVPGTAPAVTSFKLTMGGGAVLSDYTWISLLDVDEFFDPTDTLFGDHSGTANVAYCGGAYQQITVTTSPIGPTAISVDDAIYKKHLAGREVVALARMSDNTHSDLQGQIAYFFGSGSAIGSGYINLSSPSVATGRQLGTITLPDGDAMLFSQGLDPSFSWKPFFQRTTGSDDIIIDFTVLLPRPAASFRPAPQVVHGSATGWIVEGDNVMIVAVAGNTYVEQGVLIGDIIELVPNKINILQTAIATSSGYDLDHTMAYTETVVTPRYSVL